MDLNLIPFAEANRLARHRNIAIGILMVSIAGMGAYFIIKKKIRKKKENKK